MYDIHWMNTLSRVCGDSYNAGIGLTTGFIGSHTVTHNYSVYNLQLAVHYDTCRVFLLCLHWLPVFQHRKICSPATLLWKLLLHCGLSTGQIDSQLTTNCSHSAGILTDWLGSHSKTDWLTAAYHLYSMAAPTVESRGVYSARVRHIVYVILVTGHVVFTVPCRCVRVRAVAVVNKPHIAYSKHETIQIFMVNCTNVSCSLDLSSFVCMSLFCMPISLCRY
jgi:hypothetical protein